MKELRAFQVFNNIAELNEFTSEVLSTFSLKEIDRNLLVLISQYSVKVYGVCWLKVQTMADNLEVSYKTVQRSIARLVKKGIITRVGMFRVKTGGCGASLTVMSPEVLTEREEATEPTPEGFHLTVADKETIPTKAKSSKDNTYVEEPTPGVNSNYSSSQGNNELGINHLVASGVPMQFAVSTLPYFDATQVYKLWSKVLMATRKHAPDLVDTVEIAISSIKASVLASKVKRVKDFTGYFYGVLAQKLSTEQRKLKCKLFNFLQ
ncbi:helix-turn-helix domain-containing protein [Bacillus paramycoides]|uniref:helix-turn-helix domain-containing protein n=1 Tax=Bacillus paramycoides TaxID=2026194 RepID=UPI002E1D0056|nr:helix-turn-helix domain-containing protein [Bacillus paramycoides]MED1464828.1 helix-turn-helix domain-containing protein [Bacillus paramycoides]MED1493355.1 helix-turn-helix domain-containing protein [Bacillus paramycoides]